MSGCCASCCVVNISPLANFHTLRLSPSALSESSASRSLVEESSLQMLPSSSLSNAELTHIPLYVTTSSAPTSQTTPIQSDARPQAHNASTIALTPKENPMFCDIFDLVALPMSSSVRSFLSGCSSSSKLEPLALAVFFPDTSTTSHCSTHDHAAAWCDTAIPTSHIARDAQSFIPSPTIQIFLPPGSSFFNAHNVVVLSSGF